MRPLVPVRRRVQRLLDPRLPRRVYARARAAVERAYLRDARDRPDDQPADPDPLSWTRRHVYVVDGGAAVVFREQRWPKLLDPNRHWLVPASGAIVWYDILAGDVRAGLEALLTMRTSFAGPVLVDVVGCGWPEDDGEGEGDEEEEGFDGSAGSDDGWDARSRTSGASSEDLPDLYSAELAGLARGDKPPPPRPPPEEVWRLPHGRWASLVRSHPLSFDYAYVAGLLPPVEPSLPGAFEVPAQAAIVAGTMGAAAGEPPPSWQATRLRVEPLPGPGGRVRLAFEPPVFRWTRAHEHGDWWLQVRLEGGVELLGLTSRIHKLGYCYAPRLPGNLPEDWPDGVADGGWGQLGKGRGHAHVHWATVATEGDAGAFYLPDMLRAMRRLVGHARAARHRAALRIQRAWRRAVASPEHAVCVRRLEREFGELRG